MGFTVSLGTGIVYAPQDCIILIHVYETIISFLSFCRQRA